MQTTTDLDKPNYFLSDLHLEAGKPVLTDIFVRFMRGLARQADAVYLLGDIFEVWIGDDDPSPLVSEVAREIRAVVDAGVPVYFMHGNRDFLLGNAYATRAGMTLIQDPTVVEVGGAKTILGHGDLYCVDDEKYQAFRKKSRHPNWQAMVLGWPLWRRRLTARVARYLSKRNYKKKLKQTGDPTQIADASPSAVTADMKRLEASRLIHGHTHRPSEHEHDIYGKKGLRIVLSDWRESGEALAIYPDGRWQRQVLL